MKSLPAKIIALVVLAALSGCASHSPKTDPATSAAPSRTPAPPRVAKPPLWLSALSGFGIPQKLFPPKKKPPKAEAVQMIGTIKMVNKEEKFVLIDTLVYQSAGSDDVLICISNQQQTATLRSSSLRNPPFLVADITDGLPSPGDQVFKP
jgi:hypothetical protein